ncbi:glycosyltransferase [Bacillus sp. EB106-08-02-XG196]|uniref:glycosyltransferase n=1 Tax=Bacillus sp. EB106-08-02-XG196 TaxID=2737049 RepID=UPI0015C4CDE4|nr:glycosyltransferase [Bacillus sp. EB106-08-02-XG196]NWQ41097.1 glycosyltransferase [Bacillus sp. EB106-08-02-XG196]
MNCKKIAIFSPFAPPQRSAAVTRIVSLRNYLINKALETRIISPVHLKTHEEKIPDYVIYYNKITELFRIFSDFDVIIITTPPGNYAFKASIIAKLLRKKVIIDVRDPWTLAQLELNLIKKGSPKYIKQIVMEKITYILADVISFVSDYLANYMQKNRLYNSKKKVIIAPNGVEPQSFNYSKVERDVIRNELNIPKDATVLTYVGIIGGKELDKFLKVVAPLIKKNNMYILFILIVDKWSQHLKEELVDIASDLKVNNRLRIISSVEHDKVYKYLSSADIALNPLPENLNYCFPVKTFEYMANELYISAKGPSEGPLYTLIKEHDFGFYAKNWSEYYHSLENVIAMYHEDGIRSKGKEGREIVVKQFQREFANEKIYQSIMGLNQ